MIDAFMDPATCCPFSRRLVISPHMEQEQLLCDDVFYNVMRWMDGESLATASCVSSSFSRGSREEKLWEELCTKRWPSIRDSNDAAREVIAELGGFRKLYSEASRLISPPQEQEFPLAITSCSTYSRLASLVDVHFKGKALFSKFVEGVPGADEFSSWFSSCPFRMDVIQDSYLETDGEHSWCSKSEKEAVESEVKQGAIWKEMYQGMKVSWILIDRENKQVANLSSWRAVHGQRHFPTDRDFVLRYGCVVPAGANGRLVECSIILKCRRLSMTKEVGEVKLTELSLQLKEVVGGGHLNGKESLPVICQAVASAKCRDEERVLESYKLLLMLQDQAKAQEERHEWCLSFYLVVVLVVTSFLLLLHRNFWCIV